MRWIAAALFMAIVGTFALMAALFAREDEVALALVCSGVAIVAGVAMVAALNDRSAT